MRHSCVLVTGLLCVFLSTVIGSYDGGYGSTHDLDDYYEPSYPAPPIVHAPHSHGHSAGSYYHYHVPLVGQQHYQPSYHQQDHSHYLWPLLLLLALPLLFLPLLPLLLLPLGLSLLALLMPGGMMMMMMMMMMMGGGGMMMRTDTVSGRAFNEMRTFGEVLLLDMTSLMAKYARSLDLDQCPQRIACEMGAVIFAENNSTDSSTAKAFSNFIMEQYLPKGKVRRTIKQFEKAFWLGSSNLNSCKAFNCEPTFKVYKGFQEKAVNASGGSNSKNESYSFTGQPKLTTKSEELSGIQKHAQSGNSYPYSKTKTVYSSAYVSNDKNSNLMRPVEPSSPKTKRSHSSLYRGEEYRKNKDLQKASSSYIGGDKKTYFSNVFGTPTVKF